MKVVLGSTEGAEPDGKLQRTVRYNVDLTLSYNRCAAFSPGKTIETSVMYAGLVVGNVQSFVRSFTFTPDACPILTYSYG